MKFIIAFFVLSILWEIFLKIKKYIMLKKLEVNQWTRLPLDKKGKSEIFCCIICILVYILWIIRNVNSYPLYLIIIIYIVILTVFKFTDRMIYIKQKQGLLGNKGLEVIHKITDNKKGIKILTDKRIITYTKSDIILNVISDVSTQKTDNK